MRVNSLIIDDFYTNPIEVRDFALQQEYKVRGNFPGERTISFLNDDIKDLIQKVLEPSVGKITGKKVYIIGNDIDCFYHIFAERKDVEKLQVEI